MGVRRTEIAPVTISASQLEKMLRSIISSFTRSRIPLTQISRHCGIATLSPKGGGLCLGDSHASGVNPFVKNYYRNLSITNALMGRLIAATRLWHLSVRSGTGASSTQVLL